MKKLRTQTLSIEVVKQGAAQQVGRSKSTFRLVHYRLGRCKSKGEVYVIIDGVVPAPGGSTTAKWIPLSRLIPLFEQWEREDAELFPDHADKSIARFGKYFKPVLPRNSTMSGRVVAVLRKEGVLLAGDMVTILLPGYPKDFSFRKSVRNPAFGLGDLVAGCLEPSEPLEVLAVPLARVFNPEDAS